MKTVLLIEDNDSLRENIAELLTLANYKVETAENGRIGVEKVNTVKPDIIICDVMMPELDGYGVLNILSKNPDTFGIPFIFLTAKADRNDFRKGMNLGADDYISKPFESTDLIEAIEIRLKRDEKIRAAQPGPVEEPVFIDEAKGLQELFNLSNERKIKTFHKKEEIYRQEDYSNYLYFVLKGNVKTIKTDPYGKVIVNEIYGPGEFLGHVTLLDSDEYHETAVAMTDTELAVIPKAEFVELVKRNRGVAINVIKILSANIRGLEERALQLAYAPVRERVAAALLMLNQKAVDADKPGEIRISREDLASIVGTAKESLIRMLSDIKKDGLIESDGTTIKIVNEAGLKRIAC